MSVTAAKPLLRECIRCGDWFVPYRSDKWYCGTACVKAASADRLREINRARERLRRAAPASGFPPGCAERFWEKVDKTGDCWLWTGYLHNGYGRFTIDRSRPSQKAHRVAYELSGQALTKAEILHHVCGETRCVNPAHVEPMRQEDHARLGDSPPATNASKTHCVHGHEYTADNTVWHGPNGQWRTCRQCARVRNSASAARRKAERWAARGWTA